VGTQTKCSSLEKKGIFHIGAQQKFSKKKHGTVGLQNLKKSMAQSVPVELLPQIINCIRLSPLLRFIVTMEKNVRTNTSLGSMFAIKSGSPAFIDTASWQSTKVSKHF
jgi:hypothetical protein